MEVKDFRLIAGDVLALNLRQHQGAPGKCLVAVGGMVQAGHALSASTDFASPPVHSPVNGTVAEVMQDSTGPVVTIKVDDEPVWMEGALSQELPQDWPTLEQMAHDAGVVGLGGAGYPLAMKMAQFRARGGGTVVINAMACETGVSADEALLSLHAGAVIKMASTLLQVLSRDNSQARVILAVNKMYDSASELTDLVGSVSNVELVLLSASYPDGHERDVIARAVGLDVPVHEYPVDHGVLCVNVATLYALYQACSNIPLTHRLVSVVDQQNQSMVYRLPIGLPLNRIMMDTQNALVGSPAMAQRVETVRGGQKTWYHLDFSYQPELKQQHCIRCGKCQTVCPTGVNPERLWLFMQSDDIEGAHRSASLGACIACGVCDTVCPSQIPLGQTFKQGLASLRFNHSRKQMAIWARARFELREQRLAREQVHQRQIGQPEPEPTLDHNAVIQAALARKRAKVKQCK